MHLITFSFSLFPSLFSFKFFFFSFNIPMLAGYNNQHNQLDHEITTLHQPVPPLTPFSPPAPTMCIIYFQIDTICTTAPGDGMHRSSANRVNMGNSRSRGTPGNWTLFLPPIVQYLCDVTVILRRERCYMPEIAPLLVRV